MSDDYASKVAAASLSPTRLLDEATSSSSGLPRAIRAIDVKRAKPITWLVQDLWPSGEFGLLVGDGGTFKSSVTLHFAGAVAGGYPVFGKYATRQGPVFVLSGEDPDELIVMRLEAFCVGHAWDRELVLPNIHIIASGDASLGLGAWRTHLTAEVERVKPTLVICDPWAELQGADENSNTDARPVIKFTRNLAKSVGASCVVVHHMGKQSPDKRPLDRIRGASALVSASRVVYSFEWKDDGIVVENLKLTRAQIVAPFVINRTIRSLPDNRAHWELARLTSEDASKHRADRSARWILFRVYEAPGISSTELRKARAEGEPAPSNAEIARALAFLVSEGYVTETAGKQNKKTLTLTPSGTSMIVRFRSVRPRGDGATSRQEETTGTAREAPSPSETSEPADLFDSAEAPDRQVRQALENSDSPSTENLPKPAYTPSRQALGSSPPLKGGEDEQEAKAVATTIGRFSEKQPEASEEPTDADVLAELDERLGMREEGES